LPDSTGGKDIGYFCESLCHPAREATIFPIEMNAFFFRAGRGEAEDFGGGDGLSECENFWGDGLDFWEIGDAGFLDGSCGDPENYAIRGIFSRARAKGRCLVRKRFHQFYPLFQWIITSELVREHDRDRN
jgi:hypothetical protein